MPITSRYQFTTDLARGVQITPLGQLLFTGDKYGDVFRIRVQDGGKDADLTGAAVNAYLMRADHVTVPLNGDTDGSVAVVTLDAACYAVPGRAVLAVKLAQGDVLHTIFAGEGAVMRSSTDAVVDPGDVIPSLEELLAQIAVMEQATKNANAAAGTADAAADNANTVAQTVQDKLDSGALTGKGLQILGYYDTAEDLAAGVAAPEAGDAYGVGTADPYDIYVWDALHGVWVNNGPIQGPQGETGPQGPQGEPGTDGRNGADARRNLLDNSCWELPGEIVNQRGESSYTGAVYGIDRWRSWTDTNVVTISADCLTISGEAHLAQYIDPAVFVSGRTYTFAVAKKDGTVRVVSGTCPMTETAMGDGVSLRISNTETAYVTIAETGDYVWAALYEGEYTADTLPEYTPKGYTAELLECQRYYYVPAGAANMAYAGYTASTTNARITIPTPVPMRITPSVSVGTIGNVQVYGGSGASNATAVTVMQVQGNSVALQITTTGLTAWLPCTMRFNTSVTLSADL